MENLEQQFSKDLVIIKSSKSVREYSDPIPVDVLIDIFSRVSAKSIARFRCVSKFWESILRRPDFTELFLTKSIARPRLFIAFEVNEELFVFSSPQPQSPYEISSLVATPYKKFPKDFPIDICPPLYGLVFLQNLERKWRVNFNPSRKERVICNPATGEFITLPKVKPTAFSRSHFGYDVSSKQLKVLCMTWSSGSTGPNSAYVLTLETGKCLWRKIQGPVLPHTPISKCVGICINGVLYYGADFEYSNSKIACFDFRYEKFSYAKLDKAMEPRRKLTLFNYKGKLGAHQYEVWDNEKLTLWVLEDAGKRSKWSISLCIAVPSIVSNNMNVGMTSTGDIVFSPLACYHLSDPFYIVFYNIERKTYTRVEFKIKGFEDFKRRHYTFVHTFLDFVEDIKFIELCSSRLYNL